MRCPPDFNALNNRWFNLDATGGRHVGAYCEFMMLVIKSSLGASLGMGSSKGRITGTMFDWG